MKRRHGAITREQFRIRFQVINVDLEAGTFEGMASVFGSMVEAWTPTIVEPGAFVKTLQEQGDRVKILWQHDPYCPIGLPTLLEETPQGLHVIAKISDTTIGSDALTLVRDGVVSELSIGFDPIRWEMMPNPANPTDPEDAIRHLKEVRLWEVSLVTFAADPSAKILSVHSKLPAPVDFEWDETAARARVAAWARFEVTKGYQPEGWTDGGFGHRQAAMRYGAAFLLHNVVEVARRGQGPLEFKHLVYDVVGDELRLVPSALLAAAVALTRESLATDPANPDGKKKMPPGMPKMLMDAVAVMKALLDAEAPPEPDPKAPAAAARPPVAQAHAAHVDTLLREMEMAHTAMLTGVR